MAKWKSFGGSMKKIPKKKSIAELEREIAELNKAKENVNKYNDLVEKQKSLKQDIKKEGFKLRHKRALSILNRSASALESVAKRGYKTATSKKAKRFYKKIEKKL